MNNGRYVTSHAAISAASSGNNEIVAAVAGKKIVVLNYNYLTDGAVTVTWKSASTAISGAQAWTAAAQGETITSANGDGLMETVAGEALNLTLGGAVGVRGRLTYTLQ